MLSRKRMMQSCRRPWWSATLQVRDNKTIQYTVGIYDRVQGAARVESAD